MSKPSKERKQAGLPGEYTEGILHLYKSVSDRNGSYDIACEG